jgi:amino acid adenylation domain-containing protein
MGTPVANRLQPELESLIGFFVNTLVLRVDTGHDTLGDYLSHVREIHLEAQSNQDVPFEQLVERLNVPRSTSHGPLFQIMLTMNTDYGLNIEEDGASSTLTGVDIKPYSSDLIQSKFDLDVDLSISEEGVGINWNYDTSLFTEEHIVQLNEHLCRLLEGLNQTDGQSTQALTALPMLSSDEFQHLVYDLNATAMDYPKDKCIHELFEQQVRDNPDSVAVVYEENQLTYRQLNEKTNQLAHYLREQHGIEPDTLVGLCVERSLEMVIGLLGILKSGGAYVPLDPNYPQERLHYMLEDASLDVVLSQAQAEGVLAGFDGSVLLLDGLCNVTNSLFSEYSLDNVSVAEAGLSSSHLAYVIYTSGSTGQPKGVMVEHRSVNNLIYSQKNIYQFESSQRETGMILASYAFDAAVEQIFIMLLTSNTIVLPSTQELLAPDKLLKLVTNHQITHLDSTPSHLLTIVDCLNHQSVNRVISGGEAIIPQLRDAIERDTPLYNVYGPTEACVTSSTALSWESIGKPTRNTAFYLLTDLFDLVPMGSIGELYVGGDGLARGYLNRPELTAERFIANPFYDENQPNSPPRLYGTGDLVRYLPDGNLAFIGRVDDQVKVRGFRIELGEIESQLAQIETVDSSLVIAQELAGSQQLVGYIKLRGELAEVSVGDYIANVRAVLGRQLPEHMVPSVLMVVDAWPLTPNGKVDRKVLPEPDGHLLQGEYIAPEVETEHVLVSIWSDLLSLPEESISTTADFFTLGGHSLLSIRLMAEIEKRLETSVSLPALFSEPTVQGLAKAIDSGSGLEAKLSLLTSITNSELAAYDLFLIPGAASTHNDFAQLIFELKEESANIFAFNHKGLIDDEPFKSIEENAHAFVSGIQQNKRAESCVIVGHSYGGVIALETAKRMIASGYQKITLMLLDTYFEQHLFLNEMVLESEEGNLGIYDGIEISEDSKRKLAILYELQASLFDQYKPEFTNDISVHCVFAESSKIDMEKYKDYLDSFNIKDFRLSSVIGDHFTMLKDAGASEIAKTINGFRR